MQSFSQQSHTATLPHFPLQSPPPLQPPRTSAAIPRAVHAKQDFSFDDTRALSTVCLTSTPPPIRLPEGLDLDSVYELARRSPDLAELACARLLKQLEPSVRASFMRMGLSGEEAAAKAGVVLSQAHRYCMREPTENDQPTRVVSVVRKITKCRRNDWLRSSSRRMEPVEQEHLMGLLHTSTCQTVTHMWASRSGVDPEKALLDRERHSIVEATLRAILTEEERCVLMLRAEGCSYGEIILRLGLSKSEAGLRQAHKRSLARLRARLLTALGRGDSAA